jgi:hypothetical protein
MAVEYSERGLTNEIRHYVKRIPEICQKLKNLRVQEG